jgi:hypothetical protein
MADRERALRLRKAMFTWIMSVQAAARVREIFAWLDWGRLSEVQLDAIQKFVERRFDGLGMCIPVEAAVKERRWMMGPEGPPQADEVVRWALPEAGSLIPERVVIWSFLFEATVWFGSPVASSAVPPLPCPTTEPLPSSSKSS